jgi:hypothetical protein
MDQVAILVGCVVIEAPLRYPSKVNPGEAFVAFKVMHGGERISVAVYSPEAIHVAERLALDDRVNLHGRIKPRLYGTNKIYLNFTAKLIESAVPQKPPLRVV